LPRAACLGGRVGWRGDDAVHHEVGQFLNQRRLNLPCGGPEPDRHVRQDADHGRHDHADVERAELTGPDADGQQLLGEVLVPADADDVVVRFSRRADQPPYGLIDDEVS
jgi:hypothetical protein